MRTSIRGLLVSDGNPEGERDAEKAGVAAEPSRRVDLAKVSQTSCDGQFTDLEIVAPNPAFERAEHGARTAVIPGS
jgi:hypothetical protein